MAWGNAKKGFIDNGNPGSLKVERNTAWNNGDNGFKFRSSSSAMNANIATKTVNAQVSLTGPVVASGNSWQIGGDWSDSAFKSTNPATLKGARGADGRVPANDFLIPVSGQAIGATTRQDV
ncbi:hypothetical protein VE02_09666 [Pseudogymnoascus sp. 03VT05]|nr:hypothetical protein VE02_09666 [Pseudogymnoascus sp. 03VT05]